MFNREKIRRKVEQQTARDHTRMRHWSEQRENKILQGMENPLWPGLCRLLFWGMIAATVLMMAGDLLTIRSGMTSLENAAANAFFSGFCTWTLFGSVLAAACICQMKQGFSHPWYARHRFNRKGKQRMDPEKKCRFQMKTAGIGWIILLVLFLVTRHW